MSTMLEDLAEVSYKAKKARFGFAEIEYCGTADFCRFQRALLDFYKNHHATIAQNAEDSKWLQFWKDSSDDVHNAWQTDKDRLKALERAMEKYIELTHDYLFIEQVKRYADEIMRKWGFDSGEVE